MPQTIKEALGRRPFHPDLVKVDKEVIKNIPIHITDASVTDDWDGNYGTSTFALVKFRFDADEQIPPTFMTSLISGKAINKQINQLLKVKKLPGDILCKLTLTDSKSGSGSYWLLDDPYTDPAEDQVINVRALLDVITKGSEQSGDLEKAPETLDNSISTDTPGRRIKAGSKKDPVDPEPPEDPEDPPVDPEE